MTVPAIEAALADYLVRTRWFAGKGREFTVTGIRELGRVPSGRPEVRVLLVDVEYAEGTDADRRETYQVPLACYPEAQEHLDYALVATFTDPDSDDDPEVLTSPRPTTNYVTDPARSSAEEEYRLRLARRVVRKWMRHAGLQPTTLNAMDDEGEFTPAWTSGICPRLEGRIVVE